MVYQRTSGLRRRNKVQIKRCKRLDNACHNCVLERSGVSFKNVLGRSTTVVNAIRSQRCYPFGPSQPCRYITGITEQLAIKARRLAVLLLRGYGE